MAERAIDGVWLGTDIKTSANIVATEDGVFFAGRIMRKAPGDRWSRKAIDVLRGCPQEPAPGRGRAIPNFVRSELRDGERPLPPPDTLPAAQEETRVLPMFVRKADVRAFGRSPGCRGCRDVILEKSTCSPHTRECRSRMEKLLAETEEGKKRIAAAEERWTHAVVRRSDIIFAEAEEKKRKIDDTVEPAGEATLTGGSSGSGTSTQAVSRKRGPETDIREIDPAAGDAADAPETIVERTGTKRQSETDISEIDPRAGDGTDISVVDASMQRGTKPGIVLGDQDGQRASASPQRGSTPGGVAGGSGNRKPQRHGPEQMIFGERIPRDELEWRQVWSGMWPGHSSG